MKLYKDAVAAHIKLGKRTKESVPTGVLSSVNQLRNNASTTQQWLSLLKSAQPDHGKLLEVNTVMAKILTPMPLAFSIQLQKSSCLDSMRGGYHEAMAAKMSVDPPGVIRRLCGTTADAHEINKNLINDGFEWYLNSMSKGPRSKAKNKELMLHLLSFCSAMFSNEFRIVDEGSLVDMKHLCDGFELTDHREMSKSVVEKSQEHVLALNSSVDYQGILFGLVNHPHFAVVKGLAMEALESMHSTDAASGAIDKAVTMFNSFGHEQDVRQFRTEAQTVLTALQQAIVDQTPAEKVVVDFGAMTFLAKKTLQKCVSGLGVGVVEYLERCVVNATDTNFEAAAHDLFPQECDLHIGCAKAMSLGTYFNTVTLGSVVAKRIEEDLEKWQVPFARFEVRD